MFSLSSRYLSQEDVLDQSNPFVQLVGGVVWLLRNGEVYVNQSLAAECDETQETGTVPSPGVHMPQEMMLSLTRDGDTVWGHTLP